MGGSLEIPTGTARKQPEPARKRPRFDFGVMARRATLVMALFSASLAISAALSWIVADQVAPATYAATATLTADRNGAPMDEASLAGWQAFHEEFAADPRFIEAAAQQLGRRGIATLAQPGALTADLRAKFSTVSPGSGTLTLEYRGEGATRARRVVETLAATLATQGNLSRDRRADGLKSIVTSEAQVMRTPIEDKRIVYAAGLFALLVGLTLAVGFLAMRQTHAMLKKIRTEAHAADDFGHVQVPQIG